MGRQSSMVYFLLIAVNGGCGARQPTGGATGQEQVRPADATSSIRGTVTLKGRAPPQKPINPVVLTGIPLQVPQGLRTERVVVDGDNHLQWVFVYVKSAIPASTFIPPQEMRELSIEGYRYHPHVLGITLGQVLRVRNADPEIHHFHCVGGTELSKGMRSGDVVEMTLLQQDVMSLLKCDIHPWERAWIGVLSHPFYTVTDSSGSYEIRGLPEGKHTLEVWHEFYMPVTKEIEIISGTTTRLDFVLEERQ